MDHSSAVIALAALAHAHRLAVFRLLVVRGPSGALAGEIAREVGMGATAASFHLKELDRAGLVIATRQGRNVRYALHVEGVRRLLSFLTEDCCRGQPEICGSLFQPHVAAMHDERDHEPEEGCCSLPSSIVTKPETKTKPSAANTSGSKTRRKTNDKL